MAHVVRDFNDQSVDYVEDFDEDDEEILGDPDEHVYGDEIDDSGNQKNLYYDALDDDFSPGDNRVRRLQIQESDGRTTNYTGTASSGFGYGRRKNKF